MSRGRNRRRPAQRKGRSRGVEILRGVWGAALLADPDQVLGIVHGLRVDTKSRVIARILGARQLTQAILSGLRPSPEVLAMGVWVDAVHALTALGLALVDNRRARAGLTDTAIAGVWAAVGYHDLTCGLATRPAHERRRDRLAVIVLTHAPGGRFLQRAVEDNSTLPLGKLY
jgi:hypothetical protein